jgi:formylglycine-generating enzyme required for sulfatase activity
LDTPDNPIISLPEKHIWYSSLVIHDGTAYLFFEVGTGSKTEPYLATWEEASTPVGSFAPNGYGLYDMAGNVWEWVADWYDEDYHPNSPASNPGGPASGDRRVLRGGSWYNLGFYYRAAHRYNYDPSNVYSIVGFRCVRSP